MMTSTEVATYPLSNGAVPAVVEAHEVSHQYLKECIEDFVNLTTDGRMLSDRCRDYYDGKQWTSDQVSALKKRKQAPIVNNRIKVKLNGLLGLTSVRKGDPKAYPRNVDHDSDSAEAATDGLRYAADKCNLNATFLECADNFFCEGYTAVNIIPEQTPNGDVEIIVDHIPWDRIFFDPYSRKHDFSDARGKGFGLWMDEDDIVAAFPDANPDAFKEISVQTDNFEDKPRWSAKQGKRKRHLVITHYWRHKNVWMLAIYTGGGFLLSPMESPYLDEYGQPTCPLELEHAYIDREGNRYGELASFLDLQDEINHRRSKALFLLSQRQTFGNRGSMGKDIAKAKRELAKPDGHLEVNQGEFGKDFGILPTGDMAQGQFELLQEAKQEMDATSYNAQLAGERQQGDLSGIAIQRLQQSGVTELIKLFENFSSFKLRVYRQMWNRIRQSWDYVKWIRVTDDEQKLRWIGFNVPITLQQFLQETMDDTSKPYAMRLGASAQMVTLEKTNPEALNQIIQTKNRPAELDMDIILDESYDTINVSQEQLDAILKFGAQNSFDIIDLLEISNITGKEKMIDKLKARRSQESEAPPDPQSEYFTAKAAEAAANTKVKEADAQQTMIENQLLQQNPMPIPFKGSVSA